MHVCMLACEFATSFQDGRVITLHFIFLYLNLRLRWRCLLVRTNENSSLRDSLAFSRRSDSAIFCPKGQRFVQYKPLAFRTENSTFSGLFNIAKGGRERSRQGVPRLLTDPV